MDWKAVPGLENYEATSCGQLRSLGRMVMRSDGVSFYREGKVLSPSLHRNGTYRYCLRDNEGASMTITPGRITYMTFIGTIPNGYAVDLVDNSKPATVDNVKLRWTGIRTVKEVRQPVKPKPSPYKMEGFCKLMAQFLRMRLVS